MNGPASADARPLPPDAVAPPARAAAPPSAPPAPRRCGSLCESRDLLERALAAHATRRGRVEPPRARVARERALDLDYVRRAVPGRPRRARTVDQALAEQESERQFLVVARRAHRHRERLAVDPDLERLL